MNLDVAFAARLLPGDLVAGEIDPAAPARPVHPFAHALEVARVVEIVDRDTGPNTDTGRRGLRPRYTNGLAGDVYGRTDQLLLIRP